MAGSSAAAAKEAADRICVIVKERKIRFPLTWNDGQIRQAVGTALMMHRLPDNEFNDVGVIEDLIEKYGVIEDKQKPASSSSSQKENKKRGMSQDENAVDGDNNNSDDSEDGSGADNKAKKPKKTEIVANEANREIATAIKEIADIHFKNKDVRKGTVFSKAAKALREAETPITTKKEAMTLKGVGAGIAGYILEYLETGSIMKLEEMRAGTA